MNYNFKSIQTIPPADDLINIILSKTQRKTPTQVHRRKEIGTIRGFYMRKVKFTQTNLNEKLTQILNDFPKLDDIHPFYSALMNVLYDKDHYKLALGHVRGSRNLIDNVAKDYCRLIKYGDSLYRCKLLKTAAIGRMMTITKKLKSSFGFLEEVRKHMSRLPSINPFDRTLLITGFPNVGKSSFVNNVTNANVDVQPYPFTTQSLYVGHTDYNYVRWQVIDSPGILDHSLEERNTIEMQAVTALAHLKACILFFIDISENCGRTIPEQISLFKNIKPLFTNKPLLIVLTKTDLKVFEELDSSDQKALQDLAAEQNVSLVTMSNKNGDGISEVKKRACDILLDYRLNQKSENISGGNTILRREEDFLKGIHVSMPKKMRDQSRTPHVPESIKNGQKLTLDRPTLKQLQEQMGGAGVFNFPLQEHYQLENPEWKYDVIPEIMDGKNIFDFVDADILAKLKSLEKEEEMLEGLEIESEGEEVDEDFIKANKEIRNKRAILKLKHKVDKFKIRPKNVKLEKMKETLEQEDIDTQPLEDRIKSTKNKNKKLSKILRNNKEYDDNMDNQMIDEDEEQNEDRQRSASQKRLSRSIRERSRSRTQGSMPREMTEQEKVHDQLRKKIQKQWKKMNPINVSEADRKIADLKPKHLFQGKMSFERNRR